MSKTHNAGIVTAYGAAVRGGYTGTYEEFCAQQAQYAENARQMEQAVSDVKDIKTSVESAVSVAEAHADNANQSATNASNSATQASESASNANQSAESASQFADNASNSANSASQSAEDAQTSANNASTSEQNARQSAETAQDVLESVQAEGNTQISRVQAKGKEIIDSLPEDFTQVQKDIESLNGSLGDKVNLETIDKTNIVSAINSLNGIVRIIANRDTSWEGIRENVKSGYGRTLYPVGTDFSVSCPSGAPYNNIVFTVVDHRVENDEPIMTLLMKRCIYGIQFDAKQAAFVASEAMAAGTYHFKLLDNYDTEYDGGKYVQFTLVNPLVAGDQIVITWEYNQSWIGKNAYVYHAFDSTPAETCVMSEGQGGTHLGVADGISANLNHTHRLRYGSNNWQESAVREWLNSDAQAGAWQTQQTKFQRPCSYASSKAGFMSYLDPSFVEAVRTGTHLNRTNQVFDLLGTKVAYSTEERFFLLSNEEIGFSSESGIVCGSLFSFYDGANNDDRIKYDIANEDTARNWWLRTPYPSYALIERGVSSSGALYSVYASYGHGAAAACEI